MVGVFFRTAFDYFSFFLAQNECWFFPPQDSPDMNRVGDKLDGIQGEINHGYMDSKQDLVRYR